MPESKIGVGIVEVGSMSIAKHGLNHESVVSVGLIGLFLGAVVSSVIYVTNIKSDVEVIKASRVERTRIADTTSAEIKSEVSTLRQEVKTMSNDVITIKTILQERFPKKSPGP